MKQLPPGEMIEVNVDGRAYAICNVDGALHAIDAVCPHQDGPLAQGALHGHMVVCPWHAWEFDCRTGQNDRNPEIALDKVSVRVEGDDILIDAG